HADSPGKSIGADLLVGRRNIVIPQALLTPRCHQTAALDVAGILKARPKGVTACNPQYCARRPNTGQITGITGQLTAVSLM
ncbi:hypothetical protein, partial [Bordetella pseudohinzii]|uniref:hypothetical protein n=1 Tax=Bordetella pseudohinzii TaxID=1331258 RepID=UPI001F257589